MPRNPSPDSFLEDKDEILKVLAKYQSKLQADEKAIITKVSDRLKKNHLWSSATQFYNEYIKIYQSGHPIAFLASYKAANTYVRNGQVIKDFIVIEGLTDEADQLIKKQNAVKNLHVAITNCINPGQLRECLDNKDFKEFVANLKEHRSSNALLKKLFNVLNKIGLGGLMVTGIGKADKLNKFFNKHAPSIHYIDQKKDNKFKK